MIAICPNPYRDIDLKLTEKIQNLLTENGYTCIVSKVFSDSTVNILDVITELSLIVVIGGDGTILRVARNIIGHDIPILGVNLGTMGFMTSIEPDELNFIIEAAKGNYKRSTRMMLDVDLIRDDNVIYSGTCLNDVVIHGCGDTIKLNAYSDDSLIYDFSGDGIIVSSPTGSTGYAMSAGGPIVDPNAKAIILSPICAHSLSARTFVLPHDVYITINADKIHNNKSYLSVDGNTVYLIKKSDKLKIHESINTTTMVFKNDYNFFSTAYEKLM